MSTQIQWTEETWNPIAGCRKVSPGCDRCYAMRDAYRIAHNPNPKAAAAYAGLTMIQNGRVNWTGDVRELPDRLGDPLRWRRPRLIFVNSMSDLFHEGISESFIGDVFDVMQEARWHRFQVLTKRPERMAALLRAVPEHVWVGTSVEDQHRAVERVRHLVTVPAAIRFLSLEPLLEPLPDLPLEGIQWVIVGGESGAGARACDPEWIADLIRQCRTAGVACFVKQLGSVWAKKNGARHKKGGDPAEWPAELRVRAFPA